MATINLNNVTRSAQTGGGASVQFDKPGELNLGADQARELLTKIRAQITAGGTVQTGYLSLQRAANGEFSIENRSRFNPFGSKDNAAMLVKDLIRIAYGDAIGTESTGKLESAMDAYLADKSFGKKLGTVSFVRLLNALEVNVHTQSAPTADKKSWAQSLLGAGGSLAVDGQSIAEGALKIRGVHDQVVALREVTQGLMSHGTVDAIPDALAQFTAHGDLAAKIIEGYQGNQTLQGLAGMLKSEQTALAAKLNTDISARVDTLRPPGQDTPVANAPSLSTQVNSLRAIKTAINAGQADAQEPVTPATRLKVDVALAAAETALEAATAGDMAEAVDAKGLIKQTLDRLGLRADTPSARATSRLGEHDIPWALHQHQALSKGIGALKAAIDAMADKPAGQAELAGWQASLRETQGKLAERINADITLIVADCKTSATTAAAGRDSEAVLRAGASLAQLRAFIQPVASDLAQPAQRVSCVSAHTASAVVQALDDVMAAAVGAIETGEMQARLDKLAGTPQGGLADHASRALALNDLLQGMTLLATYVPAGAQADGLATLRTKTAWQAHDTLNGLKAALESTQPGGASDGAQASARGQALADFGSQVKRLLNLTQGAPALSGVLGEVQNLQASLPELTLNEARSLLLNWSSFGDPSKRIDPKVQQSIDGSSNKKALDADIVTLYQRGLFHAGDAFMSRLAGVLGQGETGSLTWLTELAAGDPAAVNGLLNEPQWDDIALRLKKSAPAAQTPQAQAKIELDHARHIALRTLDSLLRQANPTWGTGGQESFNPLNGQGMQSTRLDAVSVGALLRAAGVEVGQDLAPRPEAVHKTFEPGRGRTKGSQENPAGEVTGPLPGADRSFEQARAADVQASGKKAPTLNIESMQLMLASLIAMEAPQGEPLDAGQRAKQDRAKALLLQLPFIQASGLNANTPATQVLAKALEWSSGTQTTPEALLKAADRIRGASNKLAGDAQQLLAGLKAFEQDRDPIKAKADDQYLRLKAHLFGLNRGSEVVRQAEFETHDALFNRLARPLQTGLSSADKVNTFLGGLGQASGLEFQAAVDLSDVRGMAAQVVSESNTGRLTMREGIVKHYFGVTSEAMRKGDADTDVKVRIRNNLASHPLSADLAANGHAQRFEGLAAAVGRGPSSAAIKAGMPGLGDNLAAWQAFVGTANSPSPHGPGKAPGAAGQVAAAFGMASEETVARDHLNNLWTDLQKAVPAAASGTPPLDAAALGGLRTLAERYVALVEIGERNAEIQTAITGLKAGEELRTQAAAAVDQVREANPEAQRVAMVVMLGLFRSTGLSDLNAFRAALLAPGAEGATSSLEAQLSGRLREMNLEMISGKPMVAFCKALLVSQENANALLNDKLDGWTGQIKEAIANKLGISLVPAAPKAVATYLAQQELTTALNDRIKTLLPGQSFELRASESGEIEVTIPTTLPGVDATAGFSLGRDNGVLVRMEADNRYSVVCKQGTEAGASGGISVLGGAIKARAGLSAQVDGGFCIEYDTLSKTQTFVRALFDTPSPAQAAAFMDAAARTRVLDSTGVTAGVEASAEAEVQLTPGDMGLALGLQMRADASASVSRQQAVERSGVQTVVSTRVSYAWAASSEAVVGVLADTEKIGGAARNVASAELLRRGHENLAASVAPSELPEPAPLDGAGDEAESAETEEAEMTSVMSAKMAASTAREEFDEQRIVTRRGAIHASTSMLKGFRDQPATATATGAGTVYKEKLLEQRIGTLLAGTKFEGQLTGGGAFASRLQALLSIAGNGPYEIAVEFTLKEQVALQLADLPRKGAADPARALLADPRSYEPAKLALTVMQTSEVSSGGAPQELNIPGLEGLAPTATYRKTALAERSTVVTVDLAAMASLQPRGRI